ncbi:MAG: methylenetetrahydrofolate--tRNA-(uracil(54)-C(5))-methyltransferase (FADH(2)-oxidizing) TrmFO [Fimbriimonadaceae bacterium]
MGAGFAGVECAWACAERGIPVRLYEMRPETTTPAHTTGHFAELVCSNSLKSKAPDSPAGILKEEMTALGSLVLRCASDCEVPGGQALTVDREQFGAKVTRAIQGHPMIEVVSQEWDPGQLAAGVLTVIATGPLSTGPVSHWLANATGRRHLHFYDSVSPTVHADSVDTHVAFAASRYGKGGDDYLNCPMDKEEYHAFVRELVAAQRVPLRSFETGGVREPDTGSEDPAKIPYFAGCMPIEAIAERGERSLAFGNLKPVGLTDPRTGRRPYAVLQLRPENLERTLYSLVACQNRLKWGEQRRVFRMVPGLENAEFARFGVMHRNTFLDAPRVLDAQLGVRGLEGVFVTGQLTGVEGYVESAAMGIWSGLVAAGRTRGASVVPPPRASAMGGLLSHLSDSTEREFAPMNVNWGLFPLPSEPVRDKGVRRAAQLESARRDFASWAAQAAGSE